MEKFITYILVIALLMIANTIFKSAEVIIKGEFDFKKLYMGLCKYALILIGVSAVYYSGTLVPEIKIIDDTSILDMMNVLQMALIIKYGLSCYENLKSVFELSNEDIEKIGGDK